MRMVWFALCLFVMACDGGEPALEIAHVVDDGCPANLPARCPAGTNAAGYCASTLSQCSLPCNATQQYYCPPDSNYPLGCVSTQAAIYTECYKPVLVSAPLN